MTPNNLYLERVCMALTNYNKRCTSCGGNKWEYIRDLKLWRCKYCDAQVERQEQYDGLYTIKNVVRQVILDSAYRRMEQADRNLSECQKINARYVGTLIAGICCRMIAAVSGRSLGGQDPRGMLGQIRRDYMQLTEESMDLSDDETSLYEFLDSSDAWAVLAMVFDTLSDQQRREYLLTLVDPKQVFSKETNKSLLRFALKNDRLDLAKQVLDNEDNVDIEDAFGILLESCPDGEAKVCMGVQLLESGALKSGEEAILEDYLSGADCIKTKAALALTACDAGLVIHLDILQREVLAYSEFPIFQQILAALFRRRLYDGEIEMLLSFAAAQKDAERCMAVINAIADSGQFVALNARQAQEFIFTVSTAVELRVQMLQKLRQFMTADRMWEIVTGAYLCQVTENPDNRTIMLDALCKDLTSVPAKDFEQYVLLCNADGEMKTDRIRKILGLSSMNVGFFRELAGKYLQGNKDAPEYRGKVLHQLIECGLMIDGAVLIDYVCRSQDTPDEKVELVQMALKSGTALRADALSVYLERCSSQFAPELFALLYRDSCSVTQKALENYVLQCKDSPVVKVQNAYALAKRTGMSFGSTNCNVTHLGNKITCSLAQAYILTTSDDITLASRMVQSMVESGTKLSTTIQADKMQKKFNKYVQEKRSQLSAVAEQLCQDNRLFSRFF